MPKKHYPQKHKAEWEKEPQYIEWLAASEKSVYNSFCRACFTHILAGRSEINRHCKSTKHIKNLEKFRQLHESSDNVMENRQQSSSASDSDNDDTNEIELANTLFAVKNSRKRSFPTKAGNHASPPPYIKVKSIKKEMNIITTTNGITGHRALVTGGGSGIGFAIAKRLAEMGAYVYIMGRNVENLQQAVNDCNGLNMTAIQVDVSDWDTARVALQEILPIQLLVNNAGDNILKSVLEANEDEYEQIMGVNLKAAINLTQGVAKDLVKKNIPGVVVNISSVASERALQDHMMYCASKAALDMATKCFALELGSKKIRVNSINPTVVMTEMGRMAWSDPIKSSGLKGRIPQGRFAEVEEIVDAAIFLLSNNSSMINGQSIKVDGGFTTH